MYIRKMGFSTISQVLWEAMVGVVGGRHNQVSKGEVEILKYYYYY